jgi:hypothetical protein
MTGAAWPEPDRGLARENARRLAALLGSTAVAQRRGVLGEPLCLYRIPLHADELRLDVRVSDRACVLEGKRPGAAPATLSVALRERRYANTEHAADLSRSLGVDAFLPPEDGWRATAEALLQPPLHALIREIDWDCVRRVALFDIHLDALLSLEDVERCAGQVQLLRTLLATAVQLAPHG